MAMVQTNVGGGSPPGLFIYLGTYRISYSETLITSATVKISNPTSCQEPYDPGKNPPFDEWSTSFPRIRYKKLLPRHSRALIYEASSVHTLISCRTRYPLPTETTSNSPVPARMPPTKPLHVAVLLIPPSNSWMPPPSTSSAC